MKQMLKRIFLLTLLLIGVSQVQAQINQQNDKLYVRLAEIEIRPEFIEAYRKILVYEAKESVAKEKGVLSIFPMTIAGEPHKIRILEIYASKQAYSSHLETEHFKFYKNETAKMVKDLKLIDLETLDPEFISMIFKKAVD